MNKPVREASSMTLAEFMGPGAMNRSGAYDISDAEAIDVLVAIHDAWKNQAWSRSVPYLAVEWPPTGHGHTVVAIIHGEILGFYVGDKLWVAPAARLDGNVMEACLARDAARIRGGSVAGESGDMVAGFSERTASIHRLAHRMTIERALAEGELVAPHVLEDYRLYSTAENGGSLRARPKP